jgi:hypothetical protein
MHVVSVLPARIEVGPTISRSIYQPGQPEQNVKPETGCGNCQSYGNPQRMPSAILFDDSHSSLNREKRPIHSCHSPDGGT